MRLRHLLRERDVRGQTDEEVLSVYRDLGVVPKVGRTDNFNKTPEDVGLYKLVLEGDVVVNKMKAWQGSIAVSGHRGIVSGDYLVCDVVGDIHERFLHYLLRSAPMIEQYAIRSTGIRPSQWRLYWDGLADIEVVMPSRSEQAAVATYLDAAIARIELLVEMKQRMIDLIDERQRMLAAAQVMNELHRDNIENTPLFVVVREVSSKNVHGIETNRLSLSHGRVVTKEIDDTDGLLPESFDTYLIVESGDVVLRLTDLQNDQKSLRTGLVEERGIITSAYVVIRPAECVMPEYLWLILSGYDSMKYFYSMGGGLRQTMRFADLRHIELPLPPLYVQQAVVGEHIKTVERMADLSGKLMSQITLLIEHRKALITAAVSGELKIEGVTA